MNNGSTNSYDKYLNENDQFFYDENSSKNGFLKQDSELFNEEDYVPGSLVRVKRVCKNSAEDWKILIDNKEVLILKGTRFTAKEREYLRSAKGVLFVINGIKSGWNSVSEFKRQIKELV